MSDGDARRTSDADRYFLGQRPSLYEPRLWRPADTIRLSGFRQIFLWPLALQSGSLQGDNGQHDVRGAVRQVLKTLQKDHDRWDWLRDLSDHATRSGSDAIPGDMPAGEEERQELGRRLAERYSEFVFFHDFIQDNLFGRTETEPGYQPAGSLDPEATGPKAARRKADEDVALPPITLFRRRGSYRIEAMAGTGAKRCWYEARIERFNLYVFATGAVMLALELDLGSGGTPRVRSNATPDGADEPGEARHMTLAEAQDFADLFRRAYPPYFTPRGMAWSGATEAQVIDNSHEPLVPGGGLGKAGGVLRRVRIIRDDAANAAPSDEAEQPNDPAYDLWHAHLNVRDKKHDHRSRGAPLVFRHWREMIAPLTVAGTPKEATTAPFVFRQVVDERVPCMSFIALASSGQDPAAAVKNVTRGDWMRICFADSRGTDALPYSHHFMEDFEARHCYDRFYPSPASSMSMTRFVCSGYHFAAVGAGEYFEKVLLGHFRRHYFQLGLAVNVELASLLTFSGRATDAVKELNKAPADSRRAAQIFGQRMRTIQRDFLQFVHLFRHTGMSNQLQPSELFDLWRQRLGLTRLYDDVKGELETANNFLFASEAAEQTEAAAQLNVVASLGVVLGLAFAFLGLAVFFEGTDEKNLFGYLSETRWTLFFASTTVFSGLGLLLHRALRWKRRPTIRWLPWRRRKREAGAASVDPVSATLGGLAILSLFGLAFFKLGPSLPLFVALVIVLTSFAAVAITYERPDA